MCKDPKNKLGLTFGIFAAALHAVWAIIVGLGFGESVINYIFPLHFLNAAYEVLPFSFGTAAMLILFAFVGGFIMGWVLMVLWNWLGKKF